MKDDICVGILSRGHTMHYILDTISPIPQMLLAEKSASPKRCNAK